MIRIYVTNLGKYNEGELIGEWVELPISDEELEAVYKRIGINEHYEEVFITDFECDLDITINEYDSITHWNDIAEQLDMLDKHELLCVAARLESGEDIQEAIDGKDDVCIFYDCYTMGDVAYRCYEDMGIINEIPEHIINYIDWEAVGRDMDYSGCFVMIDCSTHAEILY